MIDKEAALIEDLVAANRILVDQGVLDGYGHVSVRHPADPQRYLMSRSLAPELVTAADVMEYDLDSTPVDARGRTTYLERFIHGEIYRARPDVKAVVHHHSPSVIPFGVGAVPLRPLYHMSAFLGGGVPVYDIKTASGRSTDMLVRGLPQRLHRDERAAAGAGAGARRARHLSRRRGGAPGGGVGGGHGRPTMGAVAAQGPGSVTLHAGPAGSTRSVRPLASRTTIGAPASISAPAVSARHSSPSTRT